MDLTPVSSSVSSVLVLVVVVLLSSVPIDASNGSLVVVLGSEAKVLHWKSTLWTYAALGSWAPDTDPGMWYGITCVGGKIMTKINLPYAGLVELPIVGHVTPADVEVALKNTRPSAHLHAHRYEKFNADYNSQILN